MHVHQVVDYPEIRVNVDRNKAGQVGLSQSDVANSLLISLSGTVTDRAGAVAELEHGRAVSDRRADAAEKDRLARCADADSDRAASASSPRGTAEGSAVGGRLTEPVIAGVRQSRREPGRYAASGECGHDDARRRAADRESLQRAAGVRRLRECGPSGSGHGRHGGSARSWSETEKTMPKTMTLDLRGQVATMETSFYRLGLGLIFAIVLVYFLMAFEFPVVAGPVHHPDRLAGRAGGHSVDAVRYSDHVQRAFSDGRDYVHRRGYREQHSGGGVRQRSAAGRA